MKVVLGRRKLKPIISLTLLKKCILIFFWFDHRSHAFEKWKQNVQTNFFLQLNQIKFMNHISERFTTRDKMIITEVQQMEIVKIVCSLYTIKPFVNYHDFRTSYWVLSLVIAQNDKISRNNLQSWWWKSKTKSNDVNSIVFRTRA